MGVKIWNDQMKNSRYFEISNIKITNSFLIFLKFILNFYVRLNCLNTQNTYMVIYHIGNFWDLIVYKSTSFEILLILGIDQFQKFCDFRNCKIEKFPVFYNMEN